MFASVDIQPASNSTWHIVVRWQGYRTSWFYSRDGLRLQSAPSEMPEAVYLIHEALVTRRAQSIQLGGMQ